MVLGGALYISGAILFVSLPILPNKSPLKRNNPHRYAERIPERFAPGKFDLFGASHQIFHTFILLAAWSHHTAICESFRYWHGEIGGTCSRF